MTSSEDEATGDRRRRPDDSESPEEQRQVRRGEQGTSTGDPHNDVDPQSG
ncbi:hypothetical protein ORV05_17150 [Amycolatopsis cynarae]|uniref:Uncharacterized protein n=1 Tax=Amycolatopsis cynarae TaxID=2995223 RepID=A0ABY7BEU4_9PSEU|nr:hypothetical protein [Amycolatopsis sp. HUAS 11-8]WAL69421.1 hypothetical protein ORV05_17150 [Amycolatopsis sp. HUAS 11-8]